MTRPKPKPKPTVNILKAKDADYNPRTIDDGALTRLERCLAEFGDLAGLTINRRSGNLICGHQRRRALTKLLKSGKIAWRKPYDTPRGQERDGHITLPDGSRFSIREVDFDETKEKAANIAANNPAIQGEFTDALPGLLDDLRVSFEPFEEIGLDLLEFSVPEIIEDGPPTPDENAPVVSRTGDLWLLGNHRLLCGDATSADDVGRLMGGEKAGLMETDPPYGVAYANNERPNPGVAKPRVANDTLVDDELQAFLEAAFKAASTTALVDNAAWYLWHAHLSQGFFAAAAAAADVILHRQIIWVKPVLLLGRGHYHWKHEPCFMGWRKGKQPPDYGRGNGERDQTTVWEVGSVTHAERKEFDHSTPKPVGLFDIPIVKHTKRGEVCYEPFAGSGPQFIACEQLGRKCYGLEIKPRYCDVIVRRWEAFSSKKATLDGKKATFAQISTKRLDTPQNPNAK